MTALIMLIKGIMLIAIAMAAFAVLAGAVGFDPMTQDHVKQCDVRPAPICLFTII